MNSNMLKKRRIVSMIIGCIAGLFLAIGISAIIDAIGKGMLSKDLNTILGLFGIGIVLNLIAIIIDKKEIYKILVMTFMVMGLLLAFIILGFLMGKNTQQFTLTTVLFNGAASVISFGLMKLFAEIEKANDQKELDMKKFLRIVCNGAILINVLNIILLTVGKVPVTIKHESIIYQIVILVLNSIAFFGVSMYKKWAVYGLILINLISIGIFIWAGYSAYVVTIPFIGTLFIIYMFREMWNEFE